MAPGASKHSVPAGKGPLPLPMPRRAESAPKAAPKTTQVKKVPKAKESAAAPNPEGIDPFSPTSSMPGNQDPVVSLG